MNKQMLLGMVAGIGVATAGGVLGYQFFGQPKANEQGSAVVDEQATAAAESQEAAATPAAHAAPAPVHHAATAAAKPTAASAPKPAPAAAQPVQLAAAAPAEECWDEEVEVTEDQTKGRTNAFALKVEGTSMIDALINDGDIVILEPTQSCDDGDMVAVWLKAENETTLKKFFHEGDRIRLSGEGEAGTRGGPAGDLYVFLSVRRHSLFEREGADVHCRVPISMVQATLGASIEVPTLDGKMARINIPAGAQSGHQFRLRAKGMPVVRSTQKGDMYIEIGVETPVNLTAKQKELLKEFEQAGKTSPESEGFFSKMKEMFSGGN